MDVNVSVTFPLFFHTQIVLVKLISVPVLHLIFSCITHTEHMVAAKSYTFLHTQLTW